MCTTHTHTHRQTTKEGLPPGDTTVGHQEQTRRNSLTQTKTHKHTEKTPPPALFHLEIKGTVMLS